MEYKKGWSTLENIVTLCTDHKSRVGFLKMQLANRGNQSFFGERIYLKIVLSIHMHAFYSSEISFEI